MIRIFKSGPHAHRMPLSYPALAPLFSDTVQFVKTPQEADLYLFAHPLDVEQAPRVLVENWRARQRPVAILSEEPFWDTIWGKKPLDRQCVVETQFGALPVVQLNHHTSKIFCFDRIPYYLLTNHRFANAYAARFARNAQLDAEDWERRFAMRSVDLTFMFERRPETYHAVRWLEGEIIGLCSWRTELALACTTSAVERLGASWQGGRTRLELENWHLDKLTRMDGHTRTLGAIENTHQPNYITEKLFDAFACGAFPIYYASPGHRVADLGLPEGTWANLFDLSPQEAAERIEAIRFQSDFFKAYVESQNQLASLFCNPLNWVAERVRLGQAVQEALTEVLDGT